MNKLKLTVTHVENEEQSLLLETDIEHLKKEAKLRGEIIEHKEADGENLYFIGSLIIMQLKSRSRKFGKIFKVIKNGNKSI